MPEKIKIHLSIIGYTPKNFNIEKIKHHRSKLFDIVDIEELSLRKEADGYNWVYTDNNIRDIVPENFSGDILIAILNIPLEDNWYVRRIENNIIAFTFDEIKYILSSYNIPLENAVLKLLYSSILTFYKFGRKIPTNDQVFSIAHQETRGCLFDLTPNKIDIINSLDRPIICESCCEDLRRMKVSENIIHTTEKEIKKIRKPALFKIIDFIKIHPIWSLIISTLYALAIGIVSAGIYDKLMSFMIK